MRQHLPRNEWATKATLDRVDFALRLPLGQGEHSVSVTAIGRCATKRNALWTYAESFDHRDDRSKGYGPADALHHIALVAIQDLPGRLEDLDLALRGGVSYVEPPLF